MKELVSAKADVDATVERDQWDRPKITTPDGKRESYVRVTTLAEALDDHYGLDRWQRAMMLQGLAARPDLYHAAQTAGKSELYKIADQAIEASGSDAAARNGSTMHALTARLDEGKPLPAGLPVNIKAMLREYAKATEHLTVLQTERFVVQDRLKVAGTFDRLVEDTGDPAQPWYIGDLKTSQSLEHIMLKTTAQVAIYAASEYYTLDQERIPIGAERDRGLLIWLPFAEEPGDAMCEVIWLDLALGRRAAMLGTKVREFRSMKSTAFSPGRMASSKGLGA